MSCYTQGDIRLSLAAVRHPRQMLPLPSDVVGVEEVIA